MNKFPNLLTASKSTQIDALIDGMMINGNGFFLTEEQAIAIEESLAGNAALLEAANNTASAAATSEQAAEAALVTANERITAHEATIAARDARIAELEAEGGAITQTSRANDEKVEVAYHDDPNNPMNKLADSLFGAPATK